LNFKQTFFFVFLCTFFDASKISPFEVLLSRFHFYIFSGNLVKNGSKKINYALTKALKQKSFDIIHRFALFCIFTVNSGILCLLLFLAMEH